MRLSCPLYCILSHYGALTGMQCPIKKFSLENQIRGRGAK
uniref:Uncharacterized protein n=1 Tax=Anguilla anguilla TaxID=7936 RepID=A0A0E9T9K2_ANGAN